MHRFLSSCEDVTLVDTLSVDKKKVACTCVDVGLSLLVVILWLSRLAFSCGGFILSFFDVVLSC